MRLLILTQYYPPETGAPQNRLHSLALNLKKVGVEVDVLTALPNYPVMEIFAEYRGRGAMEEVIDGVRVVRAPIHVSKSGGIIGRLATYFSFVWSSLRSGARLGPVDFVLCESPPLFLGLSALYLSRKLGARMVFNVSDLWPESAEKLGLVTNRALLGLAYRLEAFLYRSSVLVTGQTQGIVADIERRFPMVPVMWLPNGIDRDVYAVGEPNTDWLDQYGLRGKRLYVYAGIIGHAQGLDVIIQAKHWLQRHQPAVADEIDVVVVGDGPDRERLLALDRELGTQVVFLPNTPKAALMRMLPAASGYIVPLKRLPLFLGAIPSKIFDALGLGIPILLGVDGEARKLFIDQGGAGLYFEPENAEALARAMIRIDADREGSMRMGASGKAYVEAKFDRKAIAVRFRERLMELGAGGAA